MKENAPNLIQKMPLLVTMHRYNETSIPKLQQSNNLGNLLWKLLLRNLDRKRRIHSLPSANTKSRRGTVT